MNKKRYRRIIFFFGRVILGLIWWEMILRRIGFKKLTLRTRSKRMKNIAKTFHDMAVQMGGMMIKVGQFLSARADILPEDITAELSGLQDEVPAESFEGIKKLAEAELGAPLDEVFAQFEEEPMAAASLGQVHRGKLKGNREEYGYVDVVVKVQRPDIKTIVETDLAALRQVGNWLMRYRPIRLRADVPALLAEFSKITYEEIDYLAEGNNAVTFAENFKDIPGVRIPGVVWAHTTRQVLTLEDVYAIKITDYEQITAAGIDRAEVANRLFDVYLRQLFEDGLFHADPHPGNLFVEPGIKDENGKMDWQLTFVDFGMVGRVPPNSRAGLRELAIAVATQDADRMVTAYKLLDVLLPHADLELIAQAEAMAFDRFWGKSMDELRNIPFQEMHEFAKEFRELVFTMPFQVPHDLIFLARMVSILSGICTGLDPEFNIWEGLIPYATKLMSEDGEPRWQFLLKEAGNILQTVVALPRRMDSVFNKIERNDLSIKTPQLEKQGQQIERNTRRIVFAIVFLALLTNAVQLHLGGEMAFAQVLYGGAGLSLVGALFARRRRH